MALLKRVRLFCCFLYQLKYIGKNVEYVIGINNYPVRENCPRLSNLLTAYNPSHLHLHKNGEQGSQKGNDRAPFGIEKTVAGKLFRSPPKQRKKVR